jgi:RecA-family ATPase
MELIAEHGAIDSLLRIITVQDYNQDIAQRVTKIIHDMTISPKNVNRILNLKGPEVMINVIQAQKTY